MGGDFPPDQGDYPVSGVNWYEASAYAKYKGMVLPTSTHWNVARGGMTPMIRVPQLGGFGILAPFSNIGGKSAPVKVGGLENITTYGAYDMAGNVREWCRNETKNGRVIRGGSREDNTYEFGNVRQAPAMDRSQRNGIRLAFYPEAASIPDTVLVLQTMPVLADFREQKPVPDDIFKIYREQFSYDTGGLNANIEYRVESPGGWIREKISFDAPYGDEKIAAYLFLPLNAKPPYQTLIYFPGSASLSTPSSEEIENYYEFPMFLSFLVRNGRAVLYPVYKGTFERRKPELTPLHIGANNFAFTEYLIQLVKDFRRCIDYLETRPDIDTSKLAFYGMSWGGMIGPVITAVENRLKASVLISGGLMNRITRPEANSINYVTHIQIPTIMLNGEYDIGIDSYIRPLFEMLGTPKENKQLVLYETDHIPPRAYFIRETLTWLDKYMGPVK
jgi:dienelactone hydrolase